MQGRLLPPFQGRFQAFPADGWEDEFYRARDAGLYCIEWIVEEPNQERNPLATETGRARMRQLSNETGVIVRSVCADYYMTRLLITDAGTIDAEVEAHLGQLLGWCADFGIEQVVLPFVDNSSLDTSAKRDGAIALLRQAGPKAAALRLELDLETDLPPREFVEFLRRIDHPAVRVNQDIGNSAGLGYDPTEELTALGPFLGSVHVKDRMLGAGTVPLGTGNADFPTCFRLLSESGFNGPYILQVARGESGDEVAWARRNRLYVANLAAKESAVSDGA